MKRIIFFTQKHTRLAAPLSIAALAFLSGCGGHGHDHGDQGGHDDHGHDHGSTSHEAHDDHAGHDDHEAHDDQAGHDDHDGQDDHGHGHGAAIAVTQYTDKSELFMEYEPLIQDVPTELIIHLTRTSDFTPITKGSLEVRLISASGQTYSEIEDAPARDGIFLPIITVPFANTARMELHLKSSQLEDVQILEGIEVHAPGYHPPHEEEEEAEDPNAISFLKEQQWKIDYALEQVQARTVYQATAATATLSLPSSGEALLPAPASGIVRFLKDGAAIEVGAEASQDATLFIIEPDSSWQAGLAKLSEDYQLAQAELERVTALQRQNAVSDRRVQEANIRLQTLKTALQQIGGEAALSDPSRLRAIAKSPIEGVISEIYVKPGQRVEAGQALALVSNPDQLVLEAHVLPSRLETLGQIVDATFRSSSSSRSYRVSELNGKLISQTPLSVKGSNLASVRFQIDNPNRQLVVGSKVAAQLLGDQTTGEGVAVPVAAIQEEEGIPIVYVQTEGETVEKRYPKLGSSDGSYVQALSNIEAGERVVTKGATFIRLATLSTSEMGHGHAH